jgi:UPF0755 protein
MMQRAVAALACVLALVATATVAWVVYHTPGTVFDEEQDEGRIPPLPTDGTPVSITVEPGAGPKEIGALLADAGVVRSARLFEVLVGLTGLQGALEAGDYEFDRGLPAIEVVQRIADGRTASRSVTIPEGLRLEEVGELLEVNGIVDKDEFLAALDPALYAEPFLGQLPPSGLEGFIFPARYEFNRETDAQTVVATMLRGFTDNVYNGVQFEGQALTLAEVVTLASIIEREATVAEENATIASVFLNRLRVGIPLQADPTVQYALTADVNNVGLYGWWKAGVTLDDLRFDSPYNTYVNAGLPPGPIANPGVDTIEAVVRPAATNYLFFVSRNDGTHVFAETLEEHLRNVEIYQQP